MFKRLDASFIRSAAGVQLQNFVRGNFYMPDLHSLPIMPLMWEQSPLFLSYLQSSCPLGVQGLGGLFIEKSVYMFGEPGIIVVGRA